MGQSRAQPSHRSGAPLRAALLAILCVAPPAAAQAPAADGAAAPAGSANLNINPKRITFDRLGRSAAIYIFNQGTVAGTFDVQLIDRLMLPNGQIVPLDEAAAKPELKPLVDKLRSARAMLLATPRRVTLGASGGQTIRVRAASVAADAGTTPPGEYRTHLTVVAVPPPDTGFTAEQAAAPRDGQLSFRVNTVLGLSIPVIVRVGPVDVRAGIEHAAIGYDNLSPDGVARPVRTAVLSFELVRVGVNSLFGDLEVRGTKERGDKEPIGAVRGIGVYPEIERRFVKVALRRIPASGEQISIVFRDDDVNPGKQLVRVTLAAP